MPATTTSSLDDLILTYAIDPVVLDEHRCSFLHPLLAWIRDASGDRSGTHKFPRYDKTDVNPGVKVEGAAFTTVEQTTDSFDAVAGVVGLGRELTFEASQDSGQDMMDLIMINERAIAERITTDLLSLHTTAVFFDDFSGQPFDLDLFGQIKTAFMAQDPNGAQEQMAFVGHTETIGQLEAAMRLVSSGYADYSNAGVTAMFNTRRGFKGFIENIAVFDSTCIPENDPLNWFSGFAIIGQRGFYGLARWWDIVHRVQPSEDKATETFYSHTRYGYVGTDQLNFRGLITAKN